MDMAGKSNHHALVIGASGLIGWSIVDQLLQPYPTRSPFSKVTALVNRPLSFEDSYWPRIPSGEPRLYLASGVNLLCSDEEFEEMMKEKVSDVDSISHVYYFGKWTARLRDDSNPALMFRSVQRGKRLRRGSRGQCGHDATRRSRSKKALSIFQILGLSRWHKGELIFKRSPNAFLTSTGLWHLPPRRYIQRTFSRGTS
jgi:hypothetical protein